MTDGEPETVVSASLQKIKLIKNPIKHFVKKNCFIKSETSVSFVNHFDGHFAYLKTLDFYFQPFPFSPHQHVKGFPPNTDTSAIAKYLRALVSS